MGGHPAPPSLARSSLVLKTESSLCPGLPRALGHPICSQIVRESPGFRLRSESGSVKYLLEYSDFPSYRQEDPSPVWVRVLSKAPLPTGVPT